MKTIRLYLLFLCTIFSAQVIAQLKVVPVPHNTKASNNSGNPGSRLTANKLALPFWEDFSTYIGAPDTSLWVNSENVWVNQGLGINPPSLHVASFDGLDGNGAPYSLDPADVGLTDSLVSKPIDLTLVAPAKRSTVFLSFYYQKAGDGEPPDQNDKIELQFKTAASGWVKAWPDDPTSLNSLTALFNGVSIGIADSLFHNEFQFRFIATGRRSGLLDVWNLDYIYLDKNRSQDDFEILDRAISTIPKSIFKEYSAIPLRQLLLKDQTLADSTKIRLNNFEISEPVQGIEFSTSLTNVNTGMEIEKLVDRKALIIQAGNYLDLESEKPTIQFIQNEIATPEDTLHLELTYVVDTGDTLLIDEIDPITSDTTYIANIDLRVNDTIKRDFILHNYFAYDDGSAEFGAGVNQNGGQIAYKYYLNTPDTLIGFSMHFPNVTSVTAGLPIDLLVLKRPDGLSASQVLRETATIQNNGINEFKFYPFVTPLPVKDTIYIGWAQSTNEFIPVGLDKNTDSGSNIYFNINGEWQKNTDVSGSLMLRPVFGKGGLITAINRSEQENIILYPNPASDQFTISIIPDELTIYDFSGREIHFDSRAEFDKLIVSPKTSKSGLYLVVFTYQNKRISRKLILR